MSKITFETLVARIETIRSAERITKVELAAFSREALDFVFTTEDIRPVNAILGVYSDGKSILSPANKRIANMFFKAFLPFSVDGDVNAQIQFGKKKAKQWEKAASAALAWLEEEKNTIWTWQAENVQMETKPVDWSKRLADVAKKAIESGELSNKDILKAVMSAGISTDILMSVIEEQAAEHA